MEELKVNGVDAFIAFLSAYREEAIFSSMFGTNDKMILLFANFRTNLNERGYSEEEIDVFMEKIVVPTLENKIK